MIATTDFFTPIVDEPYDFGRIAAANAISDVYAMGGTPTLALAILGWPINKLDPAIAADVVAGAKRTCQEAGIPLAGGHSIDTVEPLFGLSVNGLVNLNNLKKNNTAKEGDLIFLTKPIGVGLLATAQKRGLLKQEDKQNWINQLSALNRIGEKLGRIKGVTAMTDVTGFGLLGHLVEMLENSNTSAQLEYQNIPKINGVDAYIQLNTMPDATFRNWNAYQQKLKLETSVNASEAFALLPDPQTNGGLLFTVNEAAQQEVQTLLMENQLAAHRQPIGKVVAREDVLVRIK